LQRHRLPRRDHHRAQRVAAPGVHQCRPFRAFM
jgi:hypothetical protein